MLRRLVERALLEPWRQSDARRAPQSDRFDWRPALVLTLAAFILFFQHYFGDRPTFDQFFYARFGKTHYYQLAAYGWFCLSKVIGYLAIPLAALPLLAMRPTETGLRLRGAARHLWIYAALFALILPVLIIASRSDGFMSTYPFYRQASRSWLDLLVWEALYALSFMALEYFFRGFLLFTLERTFGAAAIFVSVIPYCMIHFGKPAAEAAGAVVAGVVLGTLSLYTRSIWAGVLIHISVACSMDLLVLWRTGAFPTTLR